MFSLSENTKVVEKQNRRNRNSITQCLIKLATNVKNDIVRLQNNEDFVLFCFYFVLFRLLFLFVVFFFVCFCFLSSFITIIGFSILFSLY